MTTFTRSFIFFLDFWSENQVTKRNKIDFKLIIHKSMGNNSKFKGSIFRIGMSHIQITDKYSA